MDFVGLSAVTIPASVTTSTGEDYWAVANSLSDTQTRSMVFNYATASANWSVSLKPAEEAITRLRSVTAGVIIPVIYSVLFLLGAAGNSMVIYYTFIKDGLSEQAIDIYIGNLAVADLLLIMTVPCWGLTHILNGDWMFGDIGCKLMSFLLHINMFSSIFIIAAMAVNRYQVVVSGALRNTAKPKRKWDTIRYCVIIWLTSCVLSTHTLFLRKTMPRKNRNLCSWDYPDDTAAFWWIEHMISRNLVAFVIPLTVISFCYWKIVAKVKHHSFKGRTAAGRSSVKRARHVTRTVSVFVVTFVICWLPNQLSNFLQSLWHFRVLARPVAKYDQELAYLAHIFTTVLCFSNSIINPMIYSACRNKKCSIQSAVTIIIIIAFIPHQLSIST